MDVKDKILKECSHIINELKSINENVQFEDVMNMSKQVYDQLLASMDNDVELVKTISDLISLRVRVARQIRAAEEEREQGTQELQQIKQQVDNSGEL